MSVKQDQGTLLQKCAAVFAFTLYLWSPICWAATIYIAFRSWWYAVPILTYLVYINGSGLNTITSFTFPTVLKRASIWKVMASYFPVRLHKTAELSSSDSFCTEACGFTQQFPGIDLHVGTLKWNFKCPLVRELMLALGLIDVSKSTLLKVLKKPGRAVALAVGGAEESLLSRPHTLDLVLKKRQGFIRIALQTGAAVVPVLVFGENDVWHAHQVKEGMLHSIQEAVKRATGFTVPLAHGRGFFYGPVGLLPFRESINVVVGGPLQVEQYNGDMKSEEAVQLGSKHHQEYIQKLQALYDAHKDVFFSDKVSDMRLVK